MKNFKILWVIICVLLIVLSIIGYKFVQGNVASSEDDRVAVVLSKDERNLILKEMRNFLISTQGVSEAITNNDMNLVAKLATKAGMMAETNTPGSLLSKIPLSMKTLGFDTRKKFDQISADAVQLKDPSHSRRQLDQLMKNCIACHSSFKLVEEGEVVRR
ncbi:MAG: hypothetical protein ACXW11_00880 [Methylotenera sp.]